MKKKIVAGITQGDSNGIGYEVIIKSLADSRIFDICTPIIYGSSKIFGYYKRLFPEYKNLSTNNISKPRDAHHKRINIINCVPESFSPEPGRASEESAKAAVMALESAATDLKEGRLDVLITAPFNKHGVFKEGFSFPGHTEYLAKLFSVEESLMFMVSDTLKIGLVTNHLPISKVSESINANLIKQKVKLLSDSLKRDFAIDSPKIAVLSLNPHSGDHGLLGKEEEEIIKPTIKELFETGELIFGPYSSDGFFASEHFSKFDAVLAMYHDQGLIPFKSMANVNGVNFTAGLPVVRCSPDHGTAFDMAGKGSANHYSMLNAIYTACDIFKNRAQYDLLRANPLKAEMPLGGKEND